MLKAAIFDVDGTLIDSVDFHALAWHEALSRFGHQASFAEVRAQIGKGGDHLLPVFLTHDERDDHGSALEQWQSQRFKTEYMGLIKPFSAVPELLERVRGTGLAIAVASSAKQDELDEYLEIAKIKHLVDAATTSDDAERSKPSPDIFQCALDKLGISATNAVAIGDTPYDAEAAGKIGIETIGFLCGGFSEESLRAGGCASIYQSPSALLANFDRSPLRDMRPSLSVKTAG